MCKYLSICPEITALECDTLPWASPPLVSTAMAFPAPDRFSKKIFLLSGCAISTAVHGSSRFGSTKLIKWASRREQFVLGDEGQESSAPSVVCLLSYFSLFRIYTAVFQTGARRGWLTARWTNQLPVWVTPAAVSTNEKKDTLHERFKLQCCMCGCNYEKESFLEAKLQSDVDEISFKKKWKYHTNTMNVWLIWYISYFLFIYF